MKKHEFMTLPAEELRKRNVSDAADDMSSILLLSWKTDIPKKKLPLNWAIPSRWPHSLGKRGHLENPAAENSLL